MFAQIQAAEGGGPDEPWFDPLDIWHRFQEELFPALVQEAGPLLETHERFVTVLRVGAAGLCPMVTGPWLARLQLDFLEQLNGPRLCPLSTRFVWQRYRSGFFARRSAEDPGAVPAA